MLCRRISEVCGLPSELFCFSDIHFGPSSSEVHRSEVVGSLDMTLFSGLRQPVKGCGVALPHPYSSTVPSPERVLCVNISHLCRFHYGCHTFLFCVDPRFLVEVEEEHVLRLFVSHFGRLDVEFGSFSVVLFHGNSEFIHPSEGVDFCVVHAHSEVLVVSGFHV